VTGVLVYWMLYRPVRATIVTVFGRMAPARSLALAVVLGVLASALGVAAAVDGRPPLAHRLL
jgi:hypothetical protein